MHGFAFAWMSLLNLDPVRYGCADKPVVNLYDRKGLPVTPFHADDCEVGTIGNKNLYHKMSDWSFRNQNLFYRVLCYCFRGL